MADVTAKMQMGYADAADGGSSTRSYNSISADASDAALVNVAQQIYSLQDHTAKTLVSVKRVETKELELNA